jgi:hypothetical protein
MSGIGFPKPGKRRKPTPYERAIQKAAERQGITPKSHKYGARRSVCASAGHPHPSALEASVCDLLHLRQHAREIQDLKWQATVHLTRSVRWKIDWSFTVCATGEACFAEAKGKWTADAGIKLNLWRDGFGPGRLEIWQGTHKRPRLVEIVVPGRRGE